MAFQYNKNNELCLTQGLHELSLLALSRRLNRPFYIYDLDAMVERIKLIQFSFPQNTQIHFAMKALDNEYVLKAFAKLNIGVDLVSGGELELALKTGFSPQKIVFSGVGKTVREIKKAVEAEIFQINIESPAELKRVGEVAKCLGQRASVALRMNPDVSPETHPYIKTGFRENKFGMDESFYDEILTILKKYKESLKLKGLTIHIGSQIRELSPMVEAIKKTIILHEKFERAGFELETFDVGGGVGINYESDDEGPEKAMLKEYGEAVGKLLKDKVKTILCEPGRFVVAKGGLLLSEVQYIKETPYKKFAIVNTGMHHLLRPSLYQAHHRIIPVKMGQQNNYLYDIVGPICESSDVIGYERLLPEIKTGDWLAVCEAGAYGAVMASSYNLHEFPIEVVASGGQLTASQKIHNTRLFDIYTQNE